MSHDPSSQRSAQAQAKRRTILEAAEWVARRGSWPQATIAAIAAEAGVSKETVYANFGSKHALIAEMVKASVVGGQQEAKVLENPRLAEIRAEPDFARQIALWAAWLTQILVRVAPLLAVVQSGAESEPEMAALYHALHGGRRENLAGVARAIHARGPLRDGMSLEAVTETLWLLASPEAFTLATRVGGQSQEGFAATLTRLLQAAFLSGL